MKRFFNLNAGGVQTIVKGKFDNLDVAVFPDRVSLGIAAAHTFAQLAAKILAQQKIMNVAFAAAPSQDEFLAHLILRDDIKWNSIQAFQLDEYIGLPCSSPQRFANYLITRVFSERKPRRFFMMVDPRLHNRKPNELAKRYEKLLYNNPLDVVCLGIGENGHLAFNDPHVADFLDTRWVKVVKLDITSRLQQIKDGCFTSLDDVPEYALTMTIPALFSARYVICVVPGANKLEAVNRVLFGPVTVGCPASILRRHMRAILFLDKESGAELVRMKHAKKN